MEYAEFLEKKTHLGGNFGFNPAVMPDFLFDFQKSLVDWSINKGRAALFCDCGMGKTAMQLVWAENVVNYTNKNVLILAPVAVSQQTVHEAEKFGIELKPSYYRQAIKNIEAAKAGRREQISFEDFANPA